VHSGLWLGLFPGTVSRVPAIVKKHKNGPYIVLMGNGQVLIHPVLESGVVYFPGYMMQVDPHAVEPYAFGPTQFPVNGFWIKGFFLPEFNWLMAVLGLKLDPRSQGVRSFSS